VPNTMPSRHLLRHMAEQSWQTVQGTYSDNTPPAAPPAQVLCMEYIAAGAPITDSAGLQRMGIDRAALSRLIAGGWDDLCFPSCSGACSSAFCVCPCHLPLCQQGRHCRRLWLPG
jgi:hypothetical protein